MDKELPGLPDSNRRHYWVIVLFLFYAALSIVAWTLTCILSNRPLKFSSYYSQAGNFTPEQYQVNDRWREATVVLRTLSATLTLPITTAIASQAAVVYIQQKEGLSLRQTLAIADRGWTDIGTFLACVNPAMARLIWTPFLLFALFLTLIGLTIQPLQSLFIQTESMQAMTCLEVLSPGSPYEGPLYANCSNDARHTSLRLIGKEPGLEQLSSYPLAMSVNEVMGNVMDGKKGDPQIYLWSNSSDNTPRNQTSRSPSASALGSPTFSEYLSLDYLAPDGFLRPPFFISSFPNGTSTGILRVHSLAQQTDLKHEYISRSSFPDPCPGDFPFSVKYNYSYIDDEYEARVCVPGDFRASPFARSRDRQVVKEELYIDISSDKVDSGKRTMDTTQRYIAQTSRGYFELPNMWNNYTPGALLEKWPSQEVIKRDFNDNDNGIVTAMTVDDMVFTDVFGDRSITKCYQIDTEAIAGKERCSYYTPGPLTVSALALFGPGSLFDTVRLYTADENPNKQKPQDLERACRQLRQPFRGFSWSTVPATYRCSFSPGSLGMHLVLTDWLKYFSNWTESGPYTGQVYPAFGAATFYSNLAMLTKPAAMPGDWRPVFASDGQQFLRQRIGKGAKAIISTLLAFHLAGLILLTVYGVYFRAWTRTLDSFALLRIGASADKGIPNPVAMDSQVVGTLDRRDAMGRFVYRPDSIRQGRRVSRAP